MRKREDLSVISHRVSKRNYFLRIFRKAEKKYGKSEKRLAGDYVHWKKPWKVLIATIMSAQSRDEATIPIAEKLFREYGSLRKLANAKYGDVYGVFSGLNYNKTKARHVIGAAIMLVEDFGGVVPKSIYELVKLPGVGRKTANLVITECHKLDGICVDTHVHRLSNVLGIIQTKTPNQTELELRKIVPRKYWAKINRLFVLWGKDVAGRDKRKILGKLDE
jgi:endonuclease III